MRLQSGNFAVDDYGFDLDCNQETLGLEPRVSFHHLLYSNSVLINILLTTVTVRATSSSSRR